MSEVSYEESSIRCITCKVVLAQYQDKLKAELEKGKSYENVFDELGIQARDCCRINVKNLVRRFYQAEEPLSVNRYDPATGEAVFDLSALIRDENGNVVYDLASFEDKGETPYTLVRPRSYCTSTLQPVNIKAFRELMDPNIQFYPVPERPDEPLLKNNESEKNKKSSSENVSNIPKGQIKDKKITKANTSAKPVSKVAEALTIAEETPDVKAPAKTASKVSKVPTNTEETPDVKAPVKSTSKVAKASTNTEETPYVKAPAKSTSKVAKASTIVEETPKVKAPAKNASKVAKASTIAEETPEVKAPAKTASKVAKAPFKNKRTKESD
jgi:DNA-directed RNA polymerase subunit N (RpoN/RPB10)